MFIKKTKDTSKLIDTVFTIASKAKEAKKELGNEHVIDASLGSLYDEEEKFVALNSVFNSYRKLTNEEYAKYAASFSGNNDYKELIKEFVLENKLTNLKTNVVATSGGTGAIALTITNILDKNETLIVPNIGWTSYAIMAKENNINVDYYEMFDNNNNFNLLDLKNKITNSLNTQNKALVIINSPLHNPTGYSISNEEWKELVRFINEDCDNKEVVILNDIAYIDYSFNLKDSKNYLSILDNLNDNALLIIAYSYSKAFTSYGLRLGAAIIAHKNTEVIEKVSNAFDKSCRTYWSNVNNGAMINFVNVLNNNKEEYLTEKDYYINLLRKRAEIIIKESKECNLDLYPFNEGFFLTLKVDNSIKDKYHDALLKEHIYTVKVNDGIRIAICSLPINKCYGLALKLKTILEKVKD